jgi:hypothetical protein
MFNIILYKSKISQGEPTLPGYLDFRENYLIWFICQIPFFYWLSSSEAPLL